jgi:hypothetical protein
MGLKVRQSIAEQDTTGWDGAELMDQIGRIFISTPGNPDSASSDDVPGLVAVQGTFDLERVRELIDAKLEESTEHGSVEVLRFAGNKGRPTALALVSPQLLLLGDFDSVSAGIDHYQAQDPGQASNPLYLRASELAGESDIWIVANASLSDFSKDGMNQAQFLKDVESIEAGISLQKGLGLQLNLGTNSEESAAKLAAGLQLMTGMLLASQQQKPDMPNFAEKLQIAADSSLVKMAMTLDEKELEQSFGQLASSMQPSLGGSGDDVAVQGKIGGSGDWSWGEMRQPEPEPANQVITVWGLEEGKKEIPLGR